ncbi:tRNA (uracil(54)-C(5))-methyltransferase [Purpureocillium takamizusanense]|uniref:tRNA (Uracil(54)-C(5))-methyltransferase n=1 Tax=Purpureocillium takamizusanense TaxID=2060973 RepID=A0A9Q8QHI0_9HYPO|nr:tRNA (uracil(54)-C(5))-methyltransferase [Purpureocillium takamizusanense]UNI19813.1 tRNA (uracil(54)-C(5))-methyltransferase [Purpureocillium takamizusanense]
MRIAWRAPSQILSRPSSLRPPRRPPSFFLFQGRLALATMASAQPAPTAPAQVNGNGNGGGAVVDTTNKPPHKRANPGNNGGGHGKAREWKHKKTKREKNITEGSSEDVLRNDIRALLESRKAAEPASNDDDGSNGDATDELLPEEGSETDVEVLELSSTGDGLAMRPGGSRQVYVVPFSIPGDTVRVKVFRHVLRENQTVADFVSVVKPSPLRDDARVQCKYFASCGGCQFQMLDYPEQLRLKRRILEKAYRNFSNLPAELLPAIQDTIGSPLQYGYRTKLTPHFDGPPGYRPSKRSKNPGIPFESCPDVGFMQKGKRKVLDIEDCPIGTDAVRQGMTRERERMQREFKKYERGATILLRENTRRYPSGGDEVAPADGQLPPYAVRTEGDGFVDVKSCETDSKATTTEYIGDHIFTNPAGSFFQNNNSILPKFTSYIKERILPPASSSSSSSSPSSTPSSPIKYLIDAYSGSGLFTITLASVFQHSTGIDIAADSIASARKNASLNGLGEDRCKFIAADAGQLFKNVSYPRDETVVVLDPPRKGCDADFLAQLRRFGPKRILYVSCNVHTQARDVGVLVRGEGDGARYDVESLVGFDFFPQTGHVEGVAILNRHDGDKEPAQEPVGQMDS